MSSTCPTCGFDPSSVSPGDAVVALRSFVRRFQAVADPDTSERDADGEEQRRRSPSPDDDATRRRAAALAEAGEAADAIRALGEDLRAVLIEDGPSLATLEQGASGLRSDGDSATAIDRLRAATNEVATLADGQPGDAWTRTGNRSSGPVSAADLLREAVHAGSHHLRLAQDAT